MGESEGGALRLLPAVPGVFGPNYRLVEVATAFGRSVQSLRCLSLRGDFPRLFRLSRNDWRVEQADLERWAEGRWQSDVNPRLRAEAVQGAIRQPAWVRRRRRSG